MSIAYCLCPSFVGKNIVEPDSFTDIFIGCFINTKDQIVIDSNGHLWNEYLNSVKDDCNSFQLFKVWEHQLKSNKNEGKLLVSHVKPNIINEECLYESAEKAITTNMKYIVVNDNNSMKEFISRINKQKIKLLNKNNFKNLKSETTVKEFCFNKAISDINWCLSRLVRNKLNKSENECNDYIRDLLSAKDYEIKDQPREGISPTGKDKGSLDIIIEEGGSLVSIIETMILTSLNTEYIITHYNKLLHNYNPTGIPHTFLVTFYKGKDFTAWWNRYSNYITQLDPKTLASGDRTVLNPIVEQSTIYRSQKSFLQTGTISGAFFSCLHIAIDLSN
ncbi:hypothetical protein ACE02B_09195 [Shewanella mangrovisoli]|uniref:hypothetical protein n=1 Tax=Shewanella mangrovisoli TaxID=2864211 RepID=UPI0035B6AE08